MRGHIIRKILVVLIILATVFSYSGYRKQARCSCGKDVLFTLTNKQATAYFDYFCPASVG
jgi:hypothetical protein